jgi:polyisoprenoid-binding protein YceI
VLYLEGTTTLRRLAFGVGRGEWASTEWVGDEVAIRWSARLVPRGR